MKSLSVNIIVLIIGLSTMSFLKAIEAITCKEGWKPFGDSCFFFNTNKTQNKDFGDAERSCVELGGDQNSHLASCLTDDEAAFIKETLTNDYKEIGFWFGGIFQNRNNTQTNLDGTPITGLSVDELTTNYMYTAGRRCLYVLQEITNFYIESEGIVNSTMDIRVYYSSCGISNNYICKKGNSSCGPKYECPSGWFQDIDKCYTFNRNVSATHNDADAYCNSKSAQVVVIGSVYDQELFFETLTILWYTNDYKEDKYQLGAFNPSTFSNLADFIWCNSTIPTSQTASLLIKRTRWIFFCLKPCDDCANQTGAFACEKKVTKIQSP